MLITYSYRVYNSYTYFKKKIKDYSPPTVFIKVNESEKMVKIVDYTG